MKKLCLFLFSFLILFSISSVFSGNSFAYPTPVPSPVRATVSCSSGNSTVTFTWTPSTSNLTGAYYEIHYGPIDNISSTNTLMSQVNITHTDTTVTMPSYTNPNLYWWVQACGSGTCSTSIEGRPVAMTCSSPSTPGGPYTTPFCTTVSSSCASSDITCYNRTGVNASEPGAYISWDPPASGGTPTYYKLDLKSGSFSISVANISSSYHSYRFPDEIGNYGALTANTTYTAQITACNNGGCGNSTEPKSLTTSSCSSSSPGDENPTTPDSGDTAHLTIKVNGATSATFTSTNHNIGHCNNLSDGPASFTVNGSLTCSGGSVGGGSNGTKLVDTNASTDGFTGFSCDPSNPSGTCGSDGTINVGANQSATITANYGTTSTGTLQGWQDGAACQSNGTATTYGWACLSGGDTQTTVTLHDKTADGAVIGTLTASEIRPDLTTTNTGGCIGQDHGWTFTIPSTYQDDDIFAVEANGSTTRTLPLTNDHVRKSGICNSTKISLTIGLDGVGKTGDLVKKDPLADADIVAPVVTTPRAVKVKVYDSSDHLKGSGDGTISYQSSGDSKGLFKGDVSIAALTAGAYTVKVKVEEHISNTLTNQTITAAGPNIITTIPNAEAGDVAWNTGTVQDDQLTASDYAAIMSCMPATFSTADKTACTGELSKKDDLNLDGVVDQSDYNLFLREMNVRKNGSS